MHTWQVSELDRSWIVAYRDSGLSFRYISHRTGRNPSTIMCIWNQWDSEGHTEWHERSQCPPMTNAREGKYIVRSALWKRITTSQTISQEMGMRTERSIFYRTVRRRLQKNGLSAQAPLVKPPLTMQHGKRGRLWCIERQSWIQKCHIVAFLDSSRFCVPYSVGRRIRGDLICRLYALYNDIGSLHLVWWLGQPLGTWHAHLVQIDGSSYSDRYISDILYPVVVSYFRDLPKAFFQ